MNSTRLVEYESAAYVTGLTHRVRPVAGSGPHPTVVMLHGRHGTEDATWVFARTTPDNWLLVAPRAIEFEPENPESGETGFSWLLQEQRSGWPALDRFDDAVTAVRDFILALPEVYGADPDKIYLLGFSQGAAVACALALRHPDMVQGIASLVGFAPIVPDDILASRPLAGMPVWMAAGRRDERVPLDVASRGRDILIAAGADVTFREYDVGHKLNGQGLHDLADWWAKRLAGVAS